MKCIVAALDFSEATDLVLDQVCILAYREDARIRLVHVAEPEPDFVGYDNDPKALRDGVAREFQAENRALQDLAERLRRRHLVVKAMLVRGPTAEKIIEQAERAEADVIVVGSHGRRGLRRLALGSVSEEVIRRASCPVLVVPSGGRSQDAKAPKPPSSRP